MATEVISRVDKFGLMNTFNPYKNSLSLRNVSNQRFRIDNKATYADTNVICVSTGLIPNYEAFLGGGLTFNILNPNTQIVEAILLPKIVDLGSGIVPMVNEINWFDVVGMQGDFYVNAQWAGYILEVGGNIETCSITAEDINGMNSKIKTIADNITANNNELTKNLNDLYNKVKRTLKIVRDFSSSGRSTCNGNNYNNGSIINVPANFIGTIYWNGSGRGAQIGVQVLTAGVIMLTNNNIFTRVSDTSISMSGFSASGTGGTDNVNLSAYIPLYTGKNTVPVRGATCTMGVSSTASISYTVSGYIYEEVS